MIDDIKNAIFQNLSELFAEATLDEMAGDVGNYKKKLMQIASIAELLGINTEIIQVTINMKTAKVVFDTHATDKNSDIGSSLVQS